jgi:uncharacterized protein
VPADRLHYVTQVAPYQHGLAGVHGVLGQSAVAVAEIARAAGLEPVHATDVSTIDPADLSRRGALVLFTIGETPWSPAQRSAIADGVRTGALALVAIHSATDSCYGWDDYGQLVGARFDGHPWTCDITLDVVDREHPATAHLGATWSWHDEVYLFRDLRPDASVLLRARFEELDHGASGARQPAHGLPLSWCFREERGRVFSTSLGHFPGAWESPTYLTHLFEGLAWARDGDY